MLGWVFAIVWHTGVIFDGVGHFLESGVIFRLLVDFEHLE